MSENYQLVYQSRRKCEIYRDTAASKKTHLRLNKEIFKNQR